MNCSATSVYIQEVGLEAESEIGARKAIKEKIERLVKPYSTEKINLLLPMARVTQLVKNSGVDNKAAVRAELRVTLNYRAYGRLSATEPASFEGEITWREFHPR